MNCVTKPYLSLYSEPGNGVRWEGESLWSFCESFILIGHQEPCQDSTCPLSPSLEVRRTWRFLMNLEKVSDRRKYLFEAFVKVSSRLDIRNPVKTPHVLNDPSWSLGGHRDSWWTWKWCQIGGSILLMLLWNFHQDPTSVTLSKSYKTSYKKCDVQTSERTNEHTDIHNYRVRLHIFL